MCLHFLKSDLRAVLKIDDLEDKFGTICINNQEVLVKVTWQGGHLGGSHPVQPLGQFSRLLLGECWLRRCFGVLFTLIERNTDG